MRVMFPIDTVLRLVARFPRRSAVGGALLAALILAGAAAPASPPGADPQAAGEDAVDPAAEAPDVTALLRRFDELYESSGTTAHMQIETIRPDKTRSMRLRSWTKGDDKALIVIDSPPRDAGTATLRVGQNLWNYLPKIARTIRVPPSMMMGSWMGTDLTNDDLVRESSFEKDYASELIGRSDDPPGWLVRLTARPDAIGLWSRIDIVFDDEYQLPVQLHYYDRKGRLSRTMLLEDVRVMGRRPVPMRLTVIPERDEGQRTVMQYIGIGFDVDVDESMFSLTELERRR